jgi:hypothetical protein
LIAVKYPQIIVLENEDVKRGDVFLRNLSRHPYQSLVFSCSGRRREPFRRAAA